MGDGTPKLSWIFKLDQSPMVSESDMVRPEGFEPSTVSLRGSCSTN